MINDVLDWTACDKKLVNYSDKYLSAVSCRYSWVCLREWRWFRWYSHVSPSSILLCMCLNFICCLKISSGNHDQLNFCIVWDCFWERRRATWERPGSVGQDCSLLVGFTSSPGISSKTCCHPPSRQKKGSWPEAKYSKLRDKQKRVVFVCV